MMAATWTTVAMGYVNNRMPASLTKTTTAVAPTLLRTSGGVGQQILQLAVRASGGFFSSKSEGFSRYIYCLKISAIYILRIAIYAYCD
jgi:hypothetical protein